MKNKYAILTADWHLRDDQPLCRNDDFWATQIRKLKWVSQVQMKHDCPVLIAGDVFHHWKSSPRLISMAISSVPRRAFTVWGNHDLPQHSLGLCEKSALETLRLAKSIEILPGVHYGKTPEEESDDCSVFSLSNRKILIWHKMSYKIELPYPGCRTSPALDLLKKYPQYDLIVTGDNHDSFVEEHQGRLLVNPGSLTRQKADENHEPSVYLYKTADNTVLRMVVPHTKAAVSREHIEADSGHSLRFQAFIERLKGEGTVGLSFRENLDRALQNRNIIRSVRELIWAMMEDAGGK